MSDTGSKSDGASSASTPFDPPPPQEPPSAHERATGRPAADANGGTAGLVATALPQTHRAQLASLCLAALGVVYGDIGTSPLYAIRECFHGSHAVAGGPTRGNVLGVLSLVFWSLTGVIAFKYLSFIMRADNKGEGGIFALLALVPQKLHGIDARLKTGVVMLALVGAALLYGDGIITPAISVLSAVEGIGVATSAAEPVVIPLTCLILFGLFMLQKRGTAGVGRLFGPVMILWFITLGVLGARQIAAHPDVLWAVSPTWAVRFFQEHRLGGMVVLGSVFLVVTGGEALYADMGHFGRRPIRLMWFGLVMPALLLNYFGQGALLLANPDAASYLFYAMVPAIDVGGTNPLLYALVALATAATIIASQAMISGAFSLTRQAVQLGYFPRVTIKHTSAVTEGQIYVPEINNALMVACIGLVLAFQDSSKLAAAYGIAVTGNMVMTSLIFYFVATRTWRWPSLKAMPLVVSFLAFDLSFLSATSLKLFDGGWFPVLVAITLFSLMTTWKTGRAELARRFALNAIPLSTLLEDVSAMKPYRVRGTAVFMSSSPENTPPVLLHHLKHNQVLHEQVVILSVLSADQPVVPEHEQIDVVDRGNGFYRVIARYGFMQTPNVPDVLKRCREKGLVTQPNTTSYYLGRETLLTGGPARMTRWRKLLFAFLARNARSATAYFGIPPGRVVELGMQVDL